MTTGQIGRMFASSHWWDALPAEERGRYA
jgi:hypothetical protein